MTAPLMQFESHIDGRNADVRIYDDRIEYSMERGMSLTKLTTAAVTMGASTLATGLRKKGTDNSTAIPVAAISSVSTERDGLRYSKVVVLSSSGRIGFRVGHGEAPTIQSLLSQLALERPGSTVRADRHQSRMAVRGRRLSAVDRERPRGRHADRGPGSAPAPDWCGRRLLAHRQRPRVGEKPSPVGPLAAAWDRRRPGQGFTGRGRLIW
jgi:hypothetical protein